MRNTISEKYDLIILVKGSSRNKTAERGMPLDVVQDGNYTISYDDKAHSRQIYSDLDLPVSLTAYFGTGMRNNKNFNSAKVAKYLSALDGSLRSDNSMKVTNDLVSRNV